MKIVAYEYEGAVWCLTCAEVNYLAKGCVVDIEGDLIVPVYSNGASTGKPNYACGGCMRSLGNSNDWLAIDRTEIVM